MLADRLIDEILPQVTIVALDHAGIGVAEVAGDHHHRHPAHDRQTGPRVAQAMKRDRRIDAACGTLPSLGGPAQTAATAGHCAGRYAHQGAVRW